MNKNKLYTIYGGKKKDFDGCDEETQTCRQSESKPKITRSESQEAPPRPHWHFPTLLVRRRHPLIRRREAHLNLLILVSMYRLDRTKWQQIVRWWDPWRSAIFRFEYSHLQLGGSSHHFRAHCIRCHWLNRPRPSSSNLRNKSNKENIRCTESSNLNNKPNIEGC